MLLDKYQLVIFDLDGTLVHTKEEYRYKVVPETLKVLKISHKVNRKAIDKFWFDGSRNQTIKKYFKIEPKEFWKVFHTLDFMENRAKFTFAYDDVTRTLRMLKKLGKTLAITTGAPKWIAEMETKLLPRHLFSKIISITSTRYKAKPDLQSLNGCLKYLKFKPSDAVYVCNSTEDAIYAKNANVDFIYLERKEHEFKSKKLKTIHSLRELF